jgi:CDP-diacylglycerol--serine O-phosphatidyltransferase
VDLSKTLFVLPNAMTLAAVFCGFSAIRLMASPEAGPSELYRAAMLLIFAMFFDLLDGRVARLTKTQSAFGLQLDSLADVISFGVAPALLMYQWVLHRLGLGGLLAAFSYVACAAIRLARFNVLTTSDSGAPVAPGKYIIGLPSPPASGVLISLVLANRQLHDGLSAPVYTVPILGITILVGLLMVSTVRFRSFKDLRPGSASMYLVITGLVGSAVIWLAFSPQLILLWLLSFYVLFALGEAIKDALTALIRGRREEHQA